MTKVNTLSQGLIAGSFEYQHRSIDQEEGRPPYQVIDIMADGSQLFSGTIAKFSDNTKFLQMQVVNQHQDYLTPVDYAQIFMTSAAVMGMPYNKVRPALYYDQTAAHAPVALSALAKMRVALGLE